MLVQANENILSDIIRDFKKITSKRIIASINSNEKESRKRWMLWFFTKEKATDTRPAGHRFWQPDNHPEECIYLCFMWQKLNYIHNNPVIAGILYKAGECLNNSAAHYFMANKKAWLR